MRSFPCLNCSDRVVGCHATCERYINGKAEHERLKDEINKEKEYGRYANYRSDLAKSDNAKRPKLKYSKKRN